MNKNKNIPEIVTDIISEIGEEVSRVTWDCHGTPVILHKALERVAAHKGITFDTPVVVESEISQKNVALYCVGHLGDKSEWSFGEAAPYNNKIPYPYAMAEKRAKDRVILKLVGLHGYVYSEDESDEFQESRPEDIKDIPYEQPGTISPDQLKQLTELMIETKSNKVKFCELFKITDTDQLLAKDFDKAVQMLNAKKERDQ
tara:strand:- start:12 stop:614 length:603 start_codon:yes stop_codon:yes gene_type:complete